MSNAYAISNPTEAIQQAKEDARRDILFRSLLWLSDRDYITVYNCGPFSWLYKHGDDFITEDEAIALVEAS